MGTLYVLVGTAGFGTIAGMWIYALVVAAVLLTLSTWQILRANPTSRVPWMGRPEQEPGGALVLRLVGAFAGLYAGILTPTHLIGWFFVGVVVAFLPMIVLQVLHNRRVIA